MILQHGRQSCRLLAVLDYHKALISVCCHFGFVCCRLDLAVPLCRVASVAAGPDTPASNASPAGCWCYVFAATGSRLSRTNAGCHKGPAVQRCSVASVAADAISAANKTGPAGCWCYRLPATGSPSPLVTAATRALPSLRRCPAPICSLKPVSEVRSSYFACLGFAEPSGTACPTYFMHVLDKRCRHEVPAAVRMQHKARPQMRGA